MGRDEEMRLECLKLAEAAKKSGDARPLLVIAEEFYSWIQGKGVSGKSARETPASLHGQAGVVQSTMKLETDEQVKRQLTIKEMVLELLAEVFPEGLTALEILERIQARWLPGLERTSLSPQLSRLKNEELIANVEGKWRPLRNGEGVSSGD